MRLVESNKVDNNIISNLLEDEQEGRYYDVSIGFGGYIGVEEKYNVYAKNRADAVGEALDNPGSEAEQDLSVDNIEDNGDGSYTCTVSFAGNIGADNEYTVYADSEEEAEMNAIDEAKSDLEVISVDGKEFSYDDDSNFNECDKPKTKDKEKLTESADDIESLAKSVENILKQCNADISYVESYSGDNDIDSVNSKVKEYAYNRINISCKFKPDSISQYDNDVSLYGTLKFDNNLKLVKADLMTSSGPNVLNYNFIRCLDALYSYFSSGNKHYNM